MRWVAVEEVLALDGVLQDLALELLERKGCPSCTVEAEVMFEAGVLIAEAIHEDHGQDAWIQDYASRLETGGATTYLGSEEVQRVWWLLLMVEQAHKVGVYVSIGEERVGLKILATILKPLLTYESAWRNGWSAWPCSLHMKSVRMRWLLSRLAGVVVSPPGPRAYLGNRRS